MAAKKKHTAFRESEIKSMIMSILLHIIHIIRNNVLRLRVTTWPVRVSSSYNDNNTWEHGVENSKLFFISMYFLYFDNRWWTMKLVWTLFSYDRNSRYPVRRRRRVSPCRPPCLSHVATCYTTGRTPEFVLIFEVFDP